MKIFSTGNVLTLALLCGVAIADHPGTDPYALEPSINGRVSASGMFADQAEEDAHVARRQSLAFEPCINGGVSANGLYSSQAEQDAFTSTIAGT